MIRSKFVVLLFAAVCLSVLPVVAGDDSGLDFNGQMVLHTTARLEDHYVVQTGGLFIPALTGKYNLDDRSYLDFEGSLNVNGKILLEHGNGLEPAGRIKPYRVWLRYAKDQFEIRAGLQKINFGSAEMFRPLMWFDKMDIRDPLQFTDGVYGLLSKYYFENNAGIWLWGLIGNKDPRGFEIYGTSSWTPEFGGRFESPLGPGEFGLSYHHRTANVRGSDVRENRFGLNGKWDLEAGLWFESSLSAFTGFAGSDPVIKKTDMLNVGADYTFPLGNGLGATVEYFRYHLGDKFFAGGNATNVAGAMLTYPLTIMDNVSAMFFVIPEPSSSDFMAYLTWSRTYDNISLYAIAYWTPEDNGLPALQSSDITLFSGKGIQFILSYNF